MTLLVGGKEVTKVLIGGDTFSNENSVWQPIEVTMQTKTSTAYFAYVDGFIYFKPFKVYGTYHRTIPAQLDEFCTFPSEFSNLSIAHISSDWVTTLIQGITVDSAIGGLTAFKGNVFYLDLYQITGPTGGGYYDLSNIVLTATKK
ncbi:MAG TPA: hypothetical protein K8V89_08615 [Levilactobacillus brevis]|nr:hypothetical protein [Levilactobacillus brevis]